MKTCSESMLGKRLKLAKSLAVQAGAISRRYFDFREELQIETKNNLQDLVTNADREIETFISTHIWHMFPGDLIYGEENGWQSHALPEETLGTGYWLIDPIDGTANFARGIVYYCISIAYIDSEQVQLGVLYDPILQELFTGLRNRGAYLNETPIQIADAAWEQSLISLGHSVRYPGKEHSEVIAALLESKAEYRRFGSAALSLAHLSAGRLSAYYEPMVHPWDIAAGLIIAREAGARAVPYKLPKPTEKPQAAPFLVSIPNIFERLQNIQVIQNFFTNFQDSISTRE